MRGLVTLNLPSKSSHPCVGASSCPVPGGQLVLTSLPSPVGEGQASRELPSRTFTLVLCGESAREAEQMRSHVLVLR